MNLDENIYEDVHFGLDLVVPYANKPDKKPL